MQYKSRYISLVSCRKTLTTESNTPVNELLLCWMLLPKWGQQVAKNWVARLITQSVCPPTHLIKASWQAQYCCIFPPINAWQNNMSIPQCGLRFSAISGKYNAAVVAGAVCRTSKLFLPWWAELIFWRSVGWFCCCFSLASPCRSKLLLSF